MNAKTLKKVFAAVLAIAILAVGIPVSMPTVVEAANPAKPVYTAGIDQNLYDTYRPHTSHFTSTWDSATGTLSAVTKAEGISNFYGAMNAGTPDLKDEPIYVSVDFVVPENQGQYSNFGLTYGSTSTNDSQVKPFGVGVRPDIIWFGINANGNPVMGNNASIALVAGDTVNITYKYDHANLSIEIWVSDADQSVYSGVIDLSTLADFNPSMGFCAFKDQQLSNMAAWKKSMSLPAMPKFDVMQNVNIYATYKPNTSHFNATTIDPVTGLASTTGKTTVANFWAHLDGTAPTYDSTLYVSVDFVAPVDDTVGGDSNRFGLRYAKVASKWTGFCVRGKTIFWGMNEGGTTPYGGNASISYSAGDVLTFAYKYDPVANTIEMWVKNGATVKYSGVIDIATSYSDFTPSMGFAMQNGGVYNNMAAWQPKNDLPAIGDKTNLAANINGNDYFTVTKDGGKVTATSKKNPEGGLPGWWGNPGIETNLKEGEVILVSADITVPSTKIVGLIYGQIVESDGQTKRVGAAIRNTSEYYLSLDSYESGSEGVDWVTPSGVSIAAGDTFRMIYRYDTRNDTIKVWLNEGGKVVTGEVSVAEAIANNNFAFTVGFIGSAEGQVYDNIAVWKEVEVIEEEPEVYEPGDEVVLENGKVVVNEVNTDKGTIKVQIDVPEGYQLVAGSLKIGGKNIINATNDAGTEFEVEYTEGDEITAEFQPIATTSTSAAVLGTGVRRNEETNDVDGVRFVNRMYLPAVEEGAFVNVQWDTITVNYEGVQYIVKDYGMICDRSERVSGELTMDNARWTVSAKRGKIFALTDNYIDMTLVITTDNPNAEFYAREYTVRGYMVLETLDGSATRTILTNAFTDSADAAVGRGA